MKISGTQASALTVEKAGYNFWHVTNGAETFTVVRSRMPQGWEVFDSAHAPVPMGRGIGRRVLAAVNQ